MIARIVYETAIDGKLAMTILPHIFYSMLGILLVHSIINKMGSLFVEAEILRTGNE